MHRAGVRVQEGSLRSTTSQNMALMLLSVTDKFLLQWNKLIQTITSKTQQSI